MDITRTNGQFGVNLISYPNYLDIRERATTLESVFANRANVGPLVHEGGGSQVDAEAVFPTVGRVTCPCAGPLRSMPCRRSGTSEIEVIFNP